MIPERSPLQSPPAAAGRRGLFLGARRQGRRWVVIASLAGAAAFAGWRLGREPAPEGASPELARAAAQLRTRDTVYHRTVGRFAARHLPALASRFPRLLGVSSSAALRRLEACHALVGLGPKALPALSPVVEAFCDRDHEIRAYAFIALAHIAAPPPEVVARVQERSAAPRVQARHCAGLLADEDELVREYAWACLEAFGPEIEAARSTLEGFVAPGHDAELTRRAQRLLIRNEPPVRSGAPRRRPPRLRQSDEAEAMAVTTAHGRGGSGQKFVEYAVDNPFATNTLRSRQSV